MGNLFSSIPDLDGLKFPGFENPDNANSRAKLDHFLRAIVYTYRPSVLAQAVTAAYYIGASKPQLQALFDQWAPQLGKPWPDDDPEADSIGKFNIEEFLGNPEFEQRFFDYFRDELTEVTDWYEVVNDHITELWQLFPLNNFRGIKQLATAVEIDDGLIACDALAMICTENQPAAPVITEQNNTDKFQGDILKEFARVAELALQTEDYNAVVNTQCLAEIFLSKKFSKLDLNKQYLLLKYLESTFPNPKPGQGNLTPSSRIEELRNENGPNTNLEILKSGDYSKIIYYRAKLVLEYLVLDLKKKGKSSS